MRILFLKLALGVALPHRQSILSPHAISKSPSTDCGFPSEPRYPAATNAASDVSFVALSEFVYKVNAAVAITFADAISAFSFAVFETSLSLGTRIAERNHFFYNFIIKSKQLTASLFKYKRGHKNKQRGII